MYKPNLKAKKILIINIFGIGDVLFTTPLMANIKDACPDVFIGYVCNQRVAPLLQSNPHIDKVFIYEKDEYAALFKKSKSQCIGKVFSVLREIKKEGFDAVIDLSLHKYSTFLMWLVGIKQRIGFNYKNRSPFLTTKVKLVGYENKHVVDYYLDFLKPLNCPITHKELQLFLKDEDELWAGEILNKNHIKPDGHLVAIVPGGGASWGKNVNYKRWPAEKYAILADKIIEKFKATIILLGDITEKDLCRRVAGMMRQKALEIYTQNNINQFAAVLKKCKLAIVTDGGPLHVAVAVKAKTVSIFGPVDEHVYGPYPSAGLDHQVVVEDIACRPCYRRFRVADCSHHRCLQLINVDEVLERVERVL